MKAYLASLFVLASLLLVILMPHASAAVLTSQWQIVTMNGRNETNQFEAKDLMNITVYSPRTLATGGIRSIVIYSQEQRQELARYTLGFYSAGNQTVVARNLTVNLGAFPFLIRGDALLLQIVSPSNVVEFTTAVSIAVDVQALLDQQKAFFLGLIQAQNARIDLLEWSLGNAVDSMNRYLMMLAIVVAIVVAYVTRDQWLHKKRKTEEEKSTTQFEMFLETFVAERFTPGDEK